MTQTGTEGRSGDWRIGQQAWLYDVNQRGPVRVSVTKVGRKLVTVSGGGLWSKTFRIENGRANDQFGHHWILTDEQRELSDRRAAANAVINDELTRYGARGGLSVEVLEAIAALLSKSADASPSVRSVGVQ